MKQKRILCIIVCLLGSYLLFIPSLLAQEVNIHELMQRKDLTLKEVDDIAKKHFEKVGTGQGSGKKQYERWRYEQQFHLQADGHFIHPDIESRAYQSAIRTMSNSKQGERAAPSPWQELGPKSWTRTSGWNPGVGRLTSVAIHPANESIIYVSSPGGGIWKSTNAGAAWTPLIDNVNSSWMDIFNLCIDPSNQNTIYAGRTSGGVLKSTDAGATWLAMGAGPSTIKKVMVHPTNSNIVFAAASNGVYRSTNGGTTWTSVQAGSFQDIEFKPNDANIMYASTSTSSFYRSTDNGVTWTVNTLAGSGRTLIAVTAADPNIVYVVQASGSIFGRFYKSTDAGLTYTTTITGSASANNFFGYNTNGVDTRGQATYDMGICANPNNANEVHIAGIICWKSSNGGTSFVVETAWSLPNSIGYNHADVHGLEFINNTIYSVSDGGIYKSTDFGDNWTDLSSGLGIRQFYRIACAKTDANMMTGGAQDNGTTYRQANGTWREWLGADGMDNIISPTNALIAIGTSQYGSIYKTTNGGSSYSGLTHPVDANWITPLVMHPTNHDTLYGGWDGIYRSVNGGTNWTKLTTGITTGNMNCLAVAPSDTRYIYGSVNSTIYRSSDAGATWTSVAAGATVSSICVSPLNPQKIWITTTASSSNVKVSTDRGTTFTTISAGLPSMAARSVVVDNAASEGLYVGMNVGVYYRDNVNTAWVVHAAGLPLVAVNEVELQISSRKIRVGTYGRGAWETSMQDEPVAANAGADITVNCTLPSTTLTATGGSTYVWSNGATTASTTVTPTVTTTYTVTATSATGGTSTDAVVVTVNKTPPTVSISTNNGTALNCNVTNTTLTANGTGTFLWSNGATTAATTVTTAGTFSVTLTGSNGCKASAAVTTIYTAPTSNTSSASACGSYTWAVNNQTYTQSGTYTSVNDCHTETLNLTITNTTANTTTASACDIYTWAVNNQTYTQSGVYTSVNGCNTETLDLTITNSTANTTTASACDTYTWTVNGQTYTQSGVFTSVNGCHTETLNLTITNSTTNTTNVTVCDTYSWAADGQTYTQSGVYTSVNGCHTETLNLAIEDTQAPTLSNVPANVTVSCSQVPSAATPTATDNCGTPTVALVETSTKGTDPALCSFYTYSITRTWTATDDYSNTTTASQVITVRDLTAPSIAAPANITVGTPIPTAPTLTATDNCQTTPVTVTLATTTVNNTLPACYTTYKTITRKWTATDVCGNSTVTTQIVVSATQANITCPTNKSLNTNSDILNDYNCTTTMLSTSNVIPTVTNPCNLPLNYTISGATTANGTGNIVGQVIAKGVSTVTYSVGGTTCSFTITVNDTEKPRLTAAQAVIDACTFPSPIPSTFAPVSSDNCGTPTITVVSDVTANVTGCLSKAADLKYFSLLTRTYRATDANNNTTQVAQKVYLRDKVAPTAICQDITVAIGTANISLPASAINNGSFDNCSAVTFGICSGATCTSFSSTLTLRASNIPTGATFVILPVKLRVTDACGNISICTANIHLKKVGTLAGNNSDINSFTTAVERAQETAIPFESSGIDAAPNSLQCSPNPFSDDLNLRYNLAHNAENVTLKVFDIQGRLVASNEQGASLQGYYMMRWNLSELTSGLYHVCLEIDGKCVKTERVIMEK